MTVFGGGPHGAHDLHLAHALSKGVGMRGVKQILKKCLYVLEALCGCSPCLTVVVRPVWEIVMGAFSEPLWSPVIFYEGWGLH